MTKRIHIAAASDARTCCGLSTEDDTSGKWLQIASDGAGVVALRQDATCQPCFDRTMQAMAHSLDAAVAAGVITGEAAFCGLSPAELQRLAEAGFANEFVLVRFRSAGRDGSAVLSIGTLAYANTLGRFPQYAKSALDGFAWGDVRDIMAVSA